MPDRVEALLAGLDPEQRAAVLAPPGPVCILAGAGTGKTRTITHRIAVGDLTGLLPASRTLAVTFTTRAAGELAMRLRALGTPAAAASTFHAAARRQLAYFWPRLYGDPLPALVESKARLVAQAAARTGLEVSRLQVRDLAAEVEWAKASLVPAAAYPAAAARAGRVPPAPAEQVGKVLEHYETAKTRAGQLDFEDLLLVLAGVLGERADVAAEVRQRYQVFVVDEFQDVTPVQDLLLQAWLGEGDRLTVVGDPDQTIYSFAGASDRFLREFPQRWPGAQVVRLVRDYRSSAPVVAAANAVLGRRAGTGLVAAGPAGPAVRTLAYPTEQDEAAQVVSRVQQLAGEGVPLAQMAVLYRVNSQSELYEQAFAAAGVGYLVRGGERFFERGEVRDALRALRAAARGASSPTSLGAQVAAVLSGLGFDPGRPPAGRAQRERWDAWAALVALADEPGAPADLDGFVALLQDRAASRHAPTVESVTLASLHAAKGLEWDAVFLVGLTDGNLPLVHATSAAELAEERRLLYVGITRARRHLTLSWASSRAARGRGSRRPSRFLAPLLDLAPGDGPGGQTGSAAGGRGGSAAGGRGGSAAGGRGGGRRTSQQRCRVCGRPLASGTERQLGRCPDCPGGADEEVFTRLRTWRSATASRLRQPAFCVFTDATLTAIAERRPATTAELAAIPGIGAVKLDRYAAALLAVCRGEEPPAV